MDKDKIIDALVSQIQCMYENNIINGYGNESFENWCEDGEAFRTTYDDCSEDELSAMIVGMRYIADCVDNLTQKIENYKETLSEK